MSLLLLCTFLQYDAYRTTSVSSEVYGFRKNSGSKYIIDGGLFGSQNSKGDVHSTKKGQAILLSVKQ